MAVAVEVDSLSKTDELSTHGVIEQSIIRQFTSHIRDLDIQKLKIGVAARGLELLAGAGVVKSIWEYTQVGEDFEGSILKATLGLGAINLIDLGHRRIFQYLERKKSEVDVDPSYWNAYQWERKNALRSKIIKERKLAA